MLWKHKGRSLLLLLLSFSAAISAFPALAIDAGTKSELASYRQRMLTEVCIQYQNLDQTARDSQGNKVTIPIGSTTLAQLLKLPHVTGHNYLTYRGSSVSSILKAYESSPYYQTSYTQVQSYQSYFDRLTPQDPYQMPEAELISVNSASALGEFSYGGYKLTEGRFITPADQGKNVVMISEDIAKLIKLEVGEHISLGGSYKSQGTMNALIVGIYAVNPAITDQSSFRMGLPHPDANNPSLINARSALPVIYAPFDQGDQTWWQGKWNEGDADVAYYYLDSPQNVSDFVSKTKKILPRSLYSITTNVQTYNTFVQPVNEVLGNINNIAFVTFIISAFAFLLISLLSALSRKNEYVLQLIKGRNRAAIALGLFFETLFPLLISFLLAALLHSTTAYQAGTNQLSGTVMQASVNTAGSSASSGDNRIIGQFDLGNLPYLNQLGYSATASVVLSYSGLGLALLLGSSLLPTVYVFKFRRKNQKDHSV